MKKSSTEKAYAEAWYPVCLKDMFSVIVQLLISTREAITANNSLVVCFLIFTGYSFLLIHCTGFLYASQA